MFWKFDNFSSDLRFWGFNQNWVFWNFGNFPLVIGLWWVGLHWVFWDSVVVIGISEFDLNVRIVGFC